MKKFMKQKKTKKNFYINYLLGIYYAVLGGCRFILMTNEVIFKFFLLV